MFDRLEKVIGKDNLNKLNKNTVMIVGIGGVGSYATETLARNNIGKLILVDSDTVDISNINRQIEALNSTLNKNKVDVFKERIKDINPNCEVITINKFIDKSNIEELFNEKVDYLIDACDTIETKKLLILNCINKNIKFISSMGTGNKLNPSMLHITTIDKTSYDPIAKILRKWAKDNKISKKIKVVSSEEKYVKTNSRTPGSCSIVPSTAGILCASYIINDVIDM